MTAFLAQWWDVIAFISLAIIHVGSWIEIGPKLARDAGTKLEEREFAASTLNNGSVAGVTAVSILIPAAMLIIQIGSEKEGFPKNALEYVFRGSLWFLFSLFCGLVVLFLIPMRSQKYNAARDWMTGIPFGPQLFTLLIGMIWMIAGIYAALYR